VKLDNKNKEDRS